MEHGTAFLLAAILKQLLQTYPQLSRHVDGIDDPKFANKTKASQEALLKGIQSALKGLPIFQVVVDALDKCRDTDGTRHLFLECLRKLQANEDLRLMVTSRSVPDIEAEFEAAIRLEVRATEDDVERFVRGQISRFPRCLRHKDEHKGDLQDLVIQSVAKAVDGMYGCHAAYRALVTHD
jgi:hypothetical protein